MTCKEQEFKLRVVGGLDFYEVSDAFIKGLKDHQTYEACFWAFVLLQSGYHKHIWKHLAIYASQLDSNQVIELSALRNCFDLNTTAKNRKMEDGFCYICRAIVSLCRAEDSVASVMKTTISRFCNGGNFTDNMIKWEI